MREKKKGFRPRNIHDAIYFLMKHVDEYLDNRGAGVRVLSFGDIQTPQFPLESEGKAIESL